MKIQLKSILSEFWNAKTRNSKKDSFLKLSKLFHSKKVIQSIGEKNDR